LSFITADKRAH